MMSYQLLHVESIDSRGHYNTIMSSYVASVLCGMLELKARHRNSFDIYNHNYIINFAKLHFSRANRKH